MLPSDKIFTILCVIFAVLIVLGNLIYQKIVFLPVFNWYIFEISAGVILCPLTFLITDLIAEFYGRERARFCVKTALILNIAVAFSIMLMDRLEATSWSKVDNNLFHTVFGFYGIAFLGSIIACYVAQTLDIFLYLGIKKLTQGRFLWLRNSGSTAISLFVDTSIVIGFMGLFGAFPLEKLGSLTFNSYMFKLLFTICNIPVFYICVWGIKRTLYK